MTAERAVCQLSDLPILVRFEPRHFVVGGDLLSSADRRVMAQHVRDFGRHIHFFGKRRNYFVCLVVPGRLPPMPAELDLQSLAALIRLLADPTAAQVRIAEFAQAASIARDQTEASAAASSALLQLRQTTESDLALERTKHNAELAAERAAASATIEQELEQSRSANAIEHDRIQGLRQQLERKLSALFENAA